MPNLRISELDFDTIKTNLKDFLRAQDEFTDYDFEGSGLSVLIDILAYNTHYNAYLANMVNNEMFLDSAVKRSSLVSISKHLGYTPTSTRGSRATLNVTVNNPAGLPTTLTLDRYTPFTTTIDGVGYTFYNTDEYTAPAIGTQYTFTDVVVTEGSQFEINYVVANPGPDEKFEIPEVNVDTTTLIVTVQNSYTDLTTSTYTLTNDITGLDGTSKIYYIEESPLGKYQIFFGDGILGKKLEVGNIITIRYISSAGSATNVSNVVSQSFSTTNIGGSNNVNISVVSKSSSGAAKESIASIRFNAPRAYSARNRAVTSEDYSALISSSFQDAESISVWGGEDNDPPIYGKVFISLKPFAGSTISQSTKDSILNSVLKNKKVLAIQPEFVDPEYYHINLTPYVVYNQNITTKTQSNIETIVRNTITNYFTNDLQKFNKDFNKSKLIKNILESDPSIESVLITIKIQKRLILTLGRVNSFIDENSIKLQNAIVPGTLVSSRFFVLSQNTLTLANMVDVPSEMPPDPAGIGTLRLINSNTGVALESNIGTINYASGEVSISSFTPRALQNTVSDFRVTASVQETSQNIRANRNQILVLDDSTANAQIGRQAGLTINVTTASE
jgi:hypothetical protein